MKISIIIPTYNRLKSLKRVIEALEHQLYPIDDFEVVVISDGSTDGTDEYLNHLKTPLHLVPVQQANGGPASARNHGLKVAKGRIIVFLDDDVMPIPELLQEHYRFFQDNCESTVVLGTLISPPDYELLPWVEWEQQMLVKQYQAMDNEHWAPTARQFYTGNSSATRSFLLNVGGFDQSFRRAEDVELAYRLAEKGAQFIYNPRAIVYHYAERSFQSWLSTPYAYGKNEVIFFEQKGHTWLLSTLHHEFYQRNKLTRALTKTFVGHSKASQLLISLLKNSAMLSQKVGQATLANRIFSAIFNLRYYQGVSDQLGGRTVFFDMIIKGSEQKN